jgi:hypothetical protein
MLRPPVRFPSIGSRSHEPGLGRDYQIGRIGSQGFGNQLFGDIGSIRVCGIDVIDAQLDDAAKNANAFLAIPRLTPDARARQSHRSKSQPAYWKVPADVERSVVGVGVDPSRRRFLCHVHSPL